MEKKFNELQIGEKFLYNHREFTKLDEHLSIFDTVDTEIGSCQWCASSCDCDYEHSFVRKYLNNNFLNLTKFNRDDLNTMDLGDYCRLITAEEFDKYKKLIPIWKNQSFYTQSIRNGNLIYGYSFTVRDGYKYNQLSKHEAMPLRPVLNLKDDIVVESLGNPKRDYYICAYCQKEIISIDDNGFPTAKLVDNKPVCENCEIDALMPKITDDKVKNIIIKEAFRKFTQWHNLHFYSRPAIDPNEFIKKAYNEYLLAHKGEY